MKKCRLYFARWQDGKFVYYKYVLTFTKFEGEFITFQILLRIKSPIIIMFLEP